MLTTGLVIPSGTKRPPAVASTQWCKLLSKVLYVDKPYARFVYIRLGDAQTKESQTSIKLKIIDDPKFQKVVPVMAKVIYARDMKILSISNKSYFANSKFKYGS